MKRRLINYDVFEKMRSNSLSAAERELVEAGDILSHALNLTNAKLNSFDTQTALYETVDGVFVHANYKIENNRVVFENITQLVLDEETERQSARKTLSEMLDSLLEGKDEKASQMLSQYLSLPVTRRNFSESKCEDKEEAPAFVKKDKKNKKGLDKDDEKKEVKGKFNPFKAASKKDVKEWATLCQNVLSYLDYVEFGPTLKESSAQYDERGNIVAVAIPTAAARNEAKLLSFDWDVPKTQLKMLRMKGEKLSENIEFCKAIFSLKRHNAVSDNDALEEALEDIVGQWPEVLYLTQDELSQVIKTALETANATNFDDTTCDFMAEGILRTAHGAYVDRVKKIYSLAGIEECDGDDKYACFREAVKQFYPQFDENNRVQMQVFVDLYEALRKVHELAQREQNSAVQAETVHHLNDLAAVIKREIDPSTEIAEDAANWLTAIVETNLSGNAWNVSNSVHTTLVGDHPDMTKKARQSYAPASDFTGDWGDSAPVSDGKTYKSGLANKMRNSAWGNVGGSDTFPVLKNPYIQKPFGDYVIKGEKTIDKDAPIGQSAGNTWPGLQNPYVPKAETPKTYKMNKGKEQDLVVDK